MRRVGDRFGVLALVLMSLSTIQSAYAQDFQPSMVGRDGEFSAFALITSDPNWAEKWDTPPETSPSYDLAHTLEMGETGTFLVFFSGVDIPNGTTDLICELIITRADGSVASELPSTACAPGALKGPKDHVYLTRVVGEVLVDENEVAGPLIFEFSVTETASGKRIPLTIGVEIVK